MVVTFCGSIPSDRVQLSVVAAAGADELAVGVGAAGGGAVGVGAAVGVEGVVGAGAVVAVADVADDFAATRGRLLSCARATLAVAVLTTWIAADAALPAVPRVPLVPAVPLTLCAAPLRLA